MQTETVARAFEEKLAAVLSGGPDGVDVGDKDENVEIARQLVSVGYEWRRLTPTSLRQNVALLAAQPDDAFDKPLQRASSVGLRLLRIGVAATVTAALCIAAIPAARETVARQLYRVLQEVGVGPNTQIVRWDQSTPEEVAASLHQTERALASGKQWHLTTPYGGFGGGVPPGASPTLQRVDRLDILSSVTSMPIQLPTAQYRGAVPTFNHALVAPDGPVFLFFGSAGNEVLLVEASVLAGHAVQYSRVVGGEDKQGRFVTYSPELKTEELVLDGHTVVWDPDNTGLIPDSSALRWEREGVSYSLLGRALTRDEAMQLFLSLQPRDRQRPQ